MCHVVDMPSYSPVLELSLFVSPTFYVLDLLTRILLRDKIFSRFSDSYAKLRHVENQLVAHKNIFDF